jgi:antitoxin VapB
MILVEIVRINGGQSVKLPKGFEMEGEVVSIRRQGKSLILEPVKPESWPPGFFDQISIEDTAFERPAQGDAPPAPTFD